jgi:hypothetical protein
VLIIISSRGLYFGPNTIFIPPPPTCCFLLLSGLFALILPYFAFILPFYFTSPFLLFFPILPFSLPFLPFFTFPSVSFPLLIFFPQMTSGYFPISNRPLISRVRNLPIFFLYINILDALMVIKEIRDYFLIEPKMSHNYFFSTLTSVLPSHFHVGN